MWLDGDMGVTNKIKKAMYNICKEYLYIGFLLNEVKEYEYYKENGYTSVYEYAAQELNFKKSSVKNFIAVYLEFSLVEGGMHKMFLKDSYEDFNYSQLCEMLSLAPKDRQLITSDMTIREIRQIKKSLVSLDSVGQTSGRVVHLGTLPMTVRLSSGLYDCLMSYSANTGIDSSFVVEKALNIFFKSVGEGLTMDA